MIFSDTLPATGLSYGDNVSINNAGGLGAGNFDCTIAANVITCTASAAVLIETGQGFDLTISATPTTSGSYTNPATGEVCEVDPDMVINETGDTVGDNADNNSCEDTVVVDTPNLTVEKSNDANPTPVELGSSFSWTLTVTNEGSGNAFFSDGEVILHDDLPAGATYGDVEIVNQSGVTGNLDCTINAGVLECAASGDVSIEGDGTFGAQLEVTPTATGDLANPAVNGSCEVDPADVIDETTNGDNSCDDTVEVIAYDYGDAADPGYPTLDSSDGPRHIVTETSTLFLGTCVDAEPDGLQTPAANGDDEGTATLTIGGCTHDDEDGVTETSDVIQGVDATIDVVASEACTLNAWVDFNANGSFETGEAIFTNEALGAGANSLTYSVPADAAVGETAVRYRCSSDADLLPTGLASDGEVEDYIVDIQPAEADVSIQKDVDNTTPDVGSNVVFTVVVTNDGPSVATGVEVTDFLPSGYEYVSSVPEVGTYTSATGVWTVGTLEVAPATNSSRTLTITATVKAEGEYENWAEVTAQNEIDTDSNPGTDHQENDSNDTDPGTRDDPVDDDEDNATVDPVPVVDVSINKVVDNETPAVGSNVNFTITVKNDGPSDASGVAVTDQLPSGYEFVSYTVTEGDYADGTGVWTIGDLPVGEDETLQIVAKVLPEGEYQNWAEVTATNEKDTDSNPDSDHDSNDPNSGDSELVDDDEDDAEVTPQQPDLTAVKTNNVNGQAIIGEAFEWKIEVRNEGTGYALFEAADVVFEDELPGTDISYANFSVHNAGGLGIGNLDCQLTGTTIRCTATADFVMQSGQGFDLVVEATVEKGGSYTNPPTGEVCKVDPDMAIIETNDETNGTDNNSCEDTVTVEDPNLTIEKTNDANPTPLELGDSFNWTLTVTNDGVGAAVFADGEVILHDDLPADASYGDVENVNQSGVTGTVNCTINSNVLECVASGTVSIDANGTFGAQFEVTPTATGDLVNPATNGTCEVDPDNKVTETDETVDDNSCDDTVPVVAYDYGDVADPSYPTLDSSDGARHKVTEDATVYLGTCVDTEHDGLQSPNADGDDEGIATMTVGGCTHDDEDGVTETSDVIQGVDATIDVVANEACALSAWVDFNGNGSFESGEAIFTDEALTAGTNSLTYSVPASAVPGDTGVRYRCATETGLQPTGMAEDGEVEDYMIEILPAEADVSITKVVDDTTPVVGDNVFFTIVVTNDGPSVATGVEVTDLLPDGYEFVSANPEVGSYDDATGQWDVGTLQVAPAANSSRTLTVTATVNPDGEYENWAEVTDMNEVDTDSNPGTDHQENDDNDTVNPNDPVDDDEANAIVAPTPLIDLSVDKDVNDITPYVGDTVTFEITVRNDGPSLATDVELTDLLPTGYTFDGYSATLGTYNEVTGIWEVGDIAADGQETLRLHAIVLATGDYENCAEVTQAAEPDQDSDPQTGVDVDDPSSGPNGKLIDDDEDCVEVQPEPLVDVSVTKVVDTAIAIVGDTVTFTISVQNDGPSVATGVEVTDNLPAGYTFDSVIFPTGTSFNAGVWSVGTLTVMPDAEAQKELTITAVVTDVDDYENWAEVTATNEDDVDSNPDSD
ncbi:MAG: DUF11 domain-containing protein, partial [Gammaproteobacteria bacterium]|nr:DUF11 domain-containing protein [Gammaproteobacteria bacterium]